MEERSGLPMTGCAHKPSSLPEIPGPCALVLCGGGSRGALEIGFAMALAERYLRPDFIIGSSIGALNGAFLAGGMKPVSLAKLWQSFRLRKSITFNWRWLSHPRRSPGVFSLAPLRRILQAELPVTQFEDLEIPLTVVTTDLLSGQACYWRGAGDIIEPILASMSMPGIFPPMPLNGGLHVDGGIADNFPLGEACQLGARTIHMIECGCFEPCRRPPNGLIGTIGRSFEIAIQHNYGTERRQIAEDVRVNLVRPQLDFETGIFDFSRTSELVEAAYLQTGTKLETESSWAIDSGADVLPAPI